MKKVRIAAAALAVLILTGCGKTYHRPGTVDEIRGNVVSVIDNTGNIWEFYGADGWSVGDCADLVMADCGTKTIWDDEIIAANHD